MMPMFKNQPGASIRGSRSQYGPHLCHAVTLTPSLMGSTPTRPRFAVPTFRTQTWTRVGEDRHDD
jgi:hypothetical protein